MRHNLFELSVAVPSKHGMSKVPEYGHAGLTFVEGRRGQPYALKLRNDSAQRILAVVSIDGLNVVDGQPCTPQSRGYVVPAYSSAEIEGWRTSLSEVHRFKFEAKAQSYAKDTTGEVQNCGVISVKYFNEKQQPSFLTETTRTVVEEHHHHYPVYPTHPWRYPVWPEIWFTCCTDDATGAYSQTTRSGALETKSEVSADVPDFNLGTGWGEAKADNVSETAFEREKELCTLALYYAEAADLERVGIKLAKELTVTGTATPALPQAFSGFCKPPVSR